MAKVELKQPIVEEIKGYAADAKAGKNGTEKKNRREKHKTEKI